MNLQPGGFIGCSVTFAIHLVASQISRRPLASALVMTALGAALTASLLSRSVPPPPSPSKPSVPAMAYMKSGK